MSLSSELIELSQHLQQEHLFVSTEREQLQRLYHNVTLLSEKLFHNAWIARQQKLNLQQYFDQGTNAGESLEIYATNNQLEATNFIDSYKIFSYHDAKYGELFKFLYEHPLLLAAIICEADKHIGQNVPRAISLMVTSVYGNCIVQEDEHVVLQLLKALLENQIASSDNPRRLMRRQNSPFSLIYKYLTENLFSARLFLTAALYDPIMRLLMEDEWFFDIDPDKAFVRFPPAEKLRRFGEVGTDEHAQKQAQYRSYIVDKLVLLSLRFINSIKANIHCFPPCLGWLVSQVYRILIERGQVGMQEVRASCADLVFALFICPAICDPEPHGITSDVPISHIARHNLMQMAQIIQVLAISQWEEIDPKLRDLYGRFEKGCMSSVLDTFLEGPWEDITEQLASARQVQGTGLTRSAVLLMSSDVRHLIGFLRTALFHLDDKVPYKSHLEQLLSSLPADMPPSAADNLSLPGGSGVITPNSGLTDSPGTPTAERKIFSKTKVQKKKKSSTTAPQLEDLFLESTEESKMKSLGDVLVISMYPPGECPGMLTEKKVLSSLEDTEVNKSAPLSAQVHSDSAITSQATPNPEIQEKRTRFSLSHDQESIGNASDYQEVISEAASSHSVEDENENEGDNLSDMMSANVSGRGSPSISGRDTPLSQAGSVEENPAAPQLPVPVPETVRKENRVDVTERFGKFEIKAELAMERDECKSTVSDTWSTDVLASDSEPPEQNQVDRLEEVAEEMSRPLLLGSEPISEMSETASDAWSTDVLASDTDEKHSELLKDLEQDLIVGDQTEGDESLNQDEGEENLELDQHGAVGGGRQTETFSFAFPEAKSGAEDGERNGKKISPIVHHFQSGPNLQLPTLHRATSQSLKHAEGRVSAVLTAMETGTPMQPTLLPSSGAKNKVQEKKTLTSTDEQLNEFDPLATSATAAGAGGRRKSKDRWPWNKSIKSNTDQASLDAATESKSELTFSTVTPGNNIGRKSSHDSGIDIWVSTNGQMSGNSARSVSAIMNTRASLDSSLKQHHPTALPGRSSLDSSLKQHHPTALPGRSSLDSNLQRLHSVGGLSSNPDSGLQSAHMSPDSSLDINTPPLEMDNPLFHLTHSSSISVKSVSQVDLQDGITGSRKKDSLMIGQTSYMEDQTNKQKQSTPVIEVTNILNNLPSLETEDFPNIGEQQISNLNERRLSAAMTETFDPFSMPSDETESGVVTSVHDAVVKSSGITEGKTKPDPDSKLRKESVGSIVSTSSIKSTSSDSPSTQTITTVTEEKDLTDGDKQKRTISGGIFRTMKDKFHKGIKRKNTKFDKDLDAPEPEGSLKQASLTTSTGVAALPHQESTDDILAKYRTPKKPLKSGNATNNNNSSSVNNNSSSKNDATDGHCPDSQALPEDGNPQILDLDHPETCPGFVDAKRKLRLVLSTGDVFFAVGQVQSSSPREGISSRENELINLLNAQLAEAINLQNKDLVAQLYEVIRCIKMFDSEGCRKLLDSMREDYCQRGGYIAYLVRCHQGLLVTRHQLQRLLNRINREQEICSKHLTNICARNFLEKREKRMWKFIAEFQKLTLSDEKIDLVEQFLQVLYLEMTTDPLWKAATDCQLEDGRLAIERLLMSRIYTHAMFPNGDGDIMRDQLLQEHLRKLSKIISPSHKDLRIPRMYHLECPWPAAQKEIYMINAYRTPKDKIQCVLRCSQTIMNLLSMANEKSVPAADDFMPVLIFVLIKANPFGLLSTIQYVNSFYEKRLQGEEQYWWLQLTSAVEFIKTMEYSA